MHKYRCSHHENPPCKWTMLIATTKTSYLFWYLTLPSHSSTKIHNWFCMKILLKLMAQRKTVVTPLLTHRRHYSLALSYQNDILSRLLCWSHGIHLFLQIFLYDFLSVAEAHVSFAEGVWPCCGGRFTVSNTTMEDHRIVIIVWGWTGALTHCGLKWSNHNAGVVNIHEVMACCLFGAKPFFNPMFTYCQLAVPTNKLPI